MMISNKIIQLFTVATLTAGISLFAFGQLPPAQEQPDEVDQLTQMLGLTEEQQTEIRGVIDEISPQIEKLQVEARAVQEDLQEHVTGDEFDETEIRKTAAKLGDLTGEITALTVILQSKVHRAFTDEQRKQLEELERQQQQMQQQQMQQQLQQQLQQQQGQQELEPRPQP